MIKKSKTVWIRQRPDSSLLQVASPAGFDPTTIVKNLGGYLRNKDTGRGLSHEEEVKYLPSIIGVQVTDNAFPSACREYWNNFKRRIPAGLGLELEVGMYFPTEEDAEANTNAQPINLNDWITFKFASTHKNVAPNLDSAWDSTKIMFYIYNKEEQLKTDNSALTSRKEAYGLYLEVIAKRDKVKNLLIVLSRTHSDILYAVEGEAIEQDLALERMAKEYPTEFVTIGKDDKLMVKAFIEQCINKELLKRIANTDMIANKDGNIIGNNLDEAVTYISGDANIQFKETLKAQLKNIK